MSIADVIRNWRSKAKPRASSESSEAPSYNPSTTNGTPSGENSLQEKVQIVGALVDKFQNALRTDREQSGLPPLTPEIIQAASLFAARILVEAYPNKPDLALLQPDGDHAVNRLSLEARLNELRAFRPDVRTAVVNESVAAFTRRIANPEHKFWDTRASEVIPVGHTIVDMVLPFYRAGRLSRYVIDRYEQGARIAGEKLDKRDRKGNVIWVFPQHYDGPDILTLYLVPELQAFFHCKVPFGFSDDKRFVGQWILGKPKSGKTTWLSAQINADLERVEQGGCSLFVMDSQDRLVPDIAKLKRFAPGQPMHDRLIYIEPSVTHVPAINIFALDHERLRHLSPDQRFEIEGARLEMVDYFISSLLKLSLTDKQHIPFNYILPALMSIPNATIFTLRDLLSDDGLVMFEKDLRNLDKEVYKWFEEHDRKRPPQARKSEFAESRAEIAARIQGMYANPLFRKMFGAPERKLDLFDELQTGKVILINTKKGRLRKLTEAWGRFFVIQIMQAIEERMAMNRHENRPTFAYVDEAADYFANERLLKSIFTQGRKQNVGMVISHHDETDIEDFKALAALKNAAIRLQPAGNHYFSCEVDDEPTRVIRAPDIDFSRQNQFEQMTPNEWQETLRVQRAKYCIPLGITYQPSFSMGLGGDDEGDSFAE